MSVATAIFGTILAFAGGCFWMDSFNEAATSPRFMTTMTATIGTALFAFGMWIAAMV